MKQDKKKQWRRKSTTGPEASRLKLEGEWRKNVQAALTKKRPKDGWPKP